MCQAYAKEYSTCVGGSVVLIAVYFCITVVSICQGFSLYTKYAKREEASQTVAKPVSDENPASSSETTREVAAV